MSEPRSWEPAIVGLLWLARNGFDLSIAVRASWGETEGTMRAGYAEFFGVLGLNIDAGDPRRLVLFPELDEKADVPEISERCWNILGKSPDEVMCSRSRMVIKRKGSAAPVVVACTLLPCAGGFEMGASLAEAARLAAQRRGADGRRRGGHLHHRRRIGRLIGRGDAIVELTGLIALQNLSSKFSAALDVRSQGFCNRPLPPPAGAKADEK